MHLIVILNEFLLLYMTYLSPIVYTENKCLYCVKEIIIVRGGLGDICIFN
jgi:hypothetical protein